MTKARAGWVATTAAAVLLAGCGTATSSPVAQATPSPAMSCTGEPPRDAAPGRLSPSQHAVAALLCWRDVRALPGRGEWAVRLEARPTGALLRQLDAALHEPSAGKPAADVVCPLIGYLPLDLQVDLADGATTRPSVPRTVCGAPLPAAAHVLERLRADPGVRVVPVQQQRSPAAVAAGCSSGAKDVLTGPVHLDGRGAPLPETPPSAQVSVCSYAPRDGDLSLVRTGTTRGRTLGRLEVLAHPDRACPATLAGALELLVGATEQALWVETGGCGRVVGPDLRTSGYLPAATVARLAALATTPEPGA